MNVETLLNNGIYISNHAKEKMRDESISEREVKETLLNGQSIADRSTSNYRERAWNRKQHYSAYYEELNLTVVFCESLEHGILVCSTFHGKAHDISSNPYQKIH
jgi:hypothetical protein